MLRGLSKGDLRRVSGASHQYLERIHVGARTLGASARHREDRPFDGSHHCLARENVSALERVSQLFGRDLAVGWERGYQTAQELREDDPGVTPCTHE